MRKYFFLMVIPFLFSGCTENGFFEYDHKNFKIDLPVYLDEIKKKPVDAICEFECRSKGEAEKLRVAIYQDFKNCAVNDDFSIEDYYKFVADDLLDNTLEYGSLNTPIKEVINGMDALVFEVEGRYRFKEELFDMFFLSAVYETDSCYYEVTTWTDTNTKDLYYDDMMMVVRSFSLKNKN